MQLHVDAVADADLRCVSQNISRRVRRNRIAPFQNPQRTALFQLQSQSLQPFALHPQKPLSARPQLCLPPLQQQTKARNLAPKIKRN